MIFVCVKKRGGRGLANIQDNVDALIQRPEDYKNKVPKKTDFSNKKQYRRYKHQQNKNNQKKMARKTTLWTFYATNKRHLTRENVDVAKKEKP